jgi:phosphoribosylanthranilate isomerase
VFVKVCGITAEDDALLAVALGADALGFIFAPSPRQVTVSLARDIASRLPAEVVTVGVFRGQSPQRIVETVQEAGLRVAQLHGSETPEQTKWVRQRVPAVFKAFRAGDPNVRRAGEYGADVILVDSASPGSGQVFDWRLAEDVPPRTKLLLAGGLDADNVADAINQVHPWGVDVASGVEASPGKKDPRKLRAFIANAKAAAPVAYESVGGELYDWQNDS